MLKCLSWIKWSRRSNFPIRPRRASTPLSTLFRSLDDTQNPDDVVVTNKGATLLVDQISLMYLAGSEIDYVEDMIGASFQIKNPNATASCSCGSSFAI